MKTLRNLGLAVLIALALPVAAFAQASTYPGGPNTAQVLIVGARGDAAAACSSASAATLTLVNPGPGLSNYITAVAVWGLATGVPTAATPTEATMTGVGGTTPKLLPLASVYPAAGAQGSVSGGYVPLSTPIKGLTSTSIAIVAPTAITNMTIEEVACYYSAP